MKKVILYSLSLFFFIAGVGHFILDSFFISMLPEWMPLQAAIVYGSGVVEILLALGLLVKKTRKLTGLLAVIFLIAVFPVNIYMAFTAENYDVSPIGLWLRLPLQFLFIWWALKARMVE